MPRHPAGLDRPELPVESQALELAVAANANSAAGFDHRFGKLSMFREDVFLGYDPSGDARVASPAAGRKRSSLGSSATRSVA